MPSHVCPACSALSDTDKDFCPECGTKYQRGVSPQEDSSSSSKTLSSWGIGLMVAGLLIPFVWVVGWIMCIVAWRKDTTNTAAKVATYIGIGLWVVSIIVVIALAA